MLISKIFFLRGEIPFLLVEFSSPVKSLFTLLVFVNPLDALRMADSSCIGELSLFVLLELLLLLLLFDEGVVTLESLALLSRDGVVSVLGCRCRWASSFLILRTVLTGGSGGTIDVWWRLKVSESLLLV